MLGNIGYKLRSLLQYFYGFEVVNCGKREFFIII